MRSTSRRPTARAHTERLRRVIRAVDFVGPQPQFLCLASKWTSPMTNDRGACLLLRLRRTANSDARRSRPIRRERFREVSHVEL